MRIQHCFGAKTATTQVYEWFSNDYWTKIQHVSSYFWRSSYIILYDFPRVSRNWLFTSLTYFNCIWHMIMKCQDWHYFCHVFILDIVLFSGKRLYLTWFAKLIFSFVLLKKKISLISVLNHCSLACAVAAYWHCCRCCCELVVNRLLLFYT